MTKRQRVAIAGLVLFFVGCNKSPFGRTKDGSGGGAAGNFAAAGSLTVFSDELKTGGGAFEYPGGENQTLVFNDRSDPISQRSIRYAWNGQPVSNPGSTPNPEFIFAGFDLMHTITLASYAATPGRDLRPANYNKVTFFARGSLSTFTVLKIEVSEPATPAPTCYDLSTDGLTDDGNNVCIHKQLTGNWQEFTIPITNGQLASVKDFFKATFVYNNPIPGNQQPGQGGIVYFDEIFYQP